MEKKARAGVSLCVVIEIRRGKIASTRYYCVYNFESLSILILFFVKVFLFFLIGALSSHKLRLPN